MIYLFALTDAAIDMSKAFIKGVKEQLPNAVTTYDRFHLIKLMNETMGKIRADEVRQFPEMLKKARFLYPFGVIFVVLKISPVRA